MLRPIEYHGELFSSRHAGQNDWGHLVDQGRLPGPLRTLDRPNDPDQQEVGGGLRPGGLQPHGVGLQQAGPPLQKYPSTSRGKSLFYWFVLRVNKWCICFYYRIFWVLLFCTAVRKFDTCQVWIVLLGGALATASHQFKHDCPRRHVANNSIWEMCLRVLSRLSDQLVPTTKSFWNLKLCQVIISWKRRLVADFNSGLLNWAAVVAQR